MDLDLIKPKEALLFLWWMLVLKDDLNVAGLSEINIRCPTSSQAVEVSPNIAFRACVAASN